MRKIIFPRRVALLIGVLAVAAVAFTGRTQAQTAGPPDEAQQAGRNVASFPQAKEDYFRDMDNGAPMSPAQVQGRNMWLVWTGGNDRFWDNVTQFSLATFDLLKIITSHPSQTYCYGKQCDRDTRWRWMGAINEPCFDKATAPDPQHFGLWLDVRRKDCPEDPFAKEENYPGVKIGARGTTFSDGSKLPVGSYFGEPTGIVGLRLFPNPAFDQAAKDKWNAEKYYTDPDYYKNPELIKPYRVGMACGFCHVGPSPIHPPADPSNPQWSNLNSTVGAQYLWMDRVFVYGADKKNFLYQLMHSYPPGTMDTSLVSTDYINNPRTMNAIYLLGARLGQGKLWGKETLQGGELNNRQLPDYFDTPISWSPRVLKDGSDSVGVLGALNRVYLNIGLYSEEWMRHFNPFFGGKKISPIEIATAEQNSVYWRATEDGTLNLAKFLLEAGQPDKLADAPGGKQYLTADDAVLTRGKTVFAETCARCHSSKLPEEARAKMMPGGCSGPDYRVCWKNYWIYTKTPEFKAKMREIVAKPDFLKDNYLSTEARVPVTLLRTNACSPLATNAIRGNIWDNFSSSTYKDLPSVGKITVQDPFTAKRWQYTMPGKGRGFTRVPSLVSIWSTAPFLLNNRLGPYSDDPSVESRMKIFNASIEQLLWPEKRDHEANFDGTIIRTDETSNLFIPLRSIPPELKKLIDTSDVDPLKRLLDKNGDFKLGPIPKGFPIGLAASYQPAIDRASPEEITALAINFPLLKGKFLLNWPSLDLSADDAKMLAWVGNLREPLLKLSKCPDFVVNRGHYFGTAKFNETDGLTDEEKVFGAETPLTDDDKRALIEFIKTF